MRASIVIVTWNAGPEFEAVLAAIGEQTWPDGSPLCGGAAGTSRESELIVIDSDSTDDTREIARAHGARVERIQKQDFNHGSTRNFGIEIARGEFVALLTQDAKPHDAHWFAELIAPFSDPRVSGVYSRVIPRDDATPLVRRSVETDLVYDSEYQVKTIDDLTVWSRRSPAFRRAAEHFNNVSSCVRRSRALDLPFPALSFGEDLAWSGRIMRNGDALVYQPKSIVEHSHTSSLRGDFLRHRDDALLLRLLFEDCPRPLAQIRSLLGEIALDFNRLRGCPLGVRLRYGGYSPCLRLAQALGRLAGSRFADSNADRLVLERWREEHVR